jgi:hypothetical protein
VNAKSRHGSPVIFTGSVDLVGASTNTVIPDSQYLQNRYRSGVYLDELVFTVMRTDVTSDTLRNLGPYIYVKLGLDNLPFSEQFVPLWSLMPTYSRVAETTGVPLGAMEYRWVLPRPLYMAPGNVIGMIAKLVNPVNAQEDCTLNIVAKGRFTDQPAPELIDVPFVGVFVSNSVSGSIPPFVSQEVGFRSIFDFPMQIQRFIGRYVDSSDDTLAVYSDVAPVTLKLEDSNGYSIADNLPFQTIFDPQRMCWSFDGVLGRKKSYVITLSPIGTVTMANTLSSYSFVGHRSERLAR